ncbi:MULTISPECIES: helix-turn-helix transcriptional regulator [Enterobacter]|uniref:helix-turn-helix transcriptional regulator n=1 Tax=Enterobacter TaxID=547 RepID=UPI003974A839|nr:transcriptional regulator [Klebsiella sp. T2.Ur]MCL6723240.1 transcriptional regulator [Klebsiella sp. T2.Ur]
MMDNILLVVLTENNWLFTGLAALLPEMACLRMDYGTCDMPQEVKDASRVIVVVDSLIFFRGEWLTFNTLRTCREDMAVVWVTREQTGRIFPATSQGDRILAQTQDITSLGLTLREVSQSSVARKNADCVRPVRLTQTERRLLPYFTAGVSLPVLSGRLGCAVKTLYTHRQNILAKAGFRQPIFMEYVYRCNPGFSGLFSPESSSWKGIWQEEKKRQGNVSPGYVATG